MTDNLSKPSGSATSESVTDGRPITFGERAVGLSFNPGGNPAVNEIKRATADYIDYLNNARNRADDQDVKRMLSLAITDAQSSQMWAVKAVTWQ